MNQLSFGKTSKGIDAHKYSIENKKGMKVVLTDMGCAVVEIWVKDATGKYRDVALGYDDVQQYEKEGTYFGAIVGRYANRIAGAKFEIDGVEYILDANNNENNLHSGAKGLAREVWKVAEHSDNKIVFTHVAENDGYPGVANCQITYEVTEENALVISYLATADKKSPFNMTNHTYFNLNGHDAGTILNHELMIKASGYTPVIDDKAIPTGEVATVEGTPFDFRVAKPIGRDIEEEFDQLIFGQGYDHNFALDKETDGVEKIATAYSADSGITMDVYTDCVGVQLYTGNFLEGDLGKSGHHYERRAGFCLETQFFPNSINEPNFLRPVTEAGEKYQTQTIYKFDTK
ncbi:MAG: galactose mutarotase [Agathobacter sp.]|nr:galactose mutarotase [Agathobacter sp.]